MKQVLIVGYVWPEPNSSAAGTRMLELIRCFIAMGAEVTFASAAALSSHRFNLAALGVREQEIVLNCASFNTFVAQLQPDLVLFDRFFTEEQFAWRVADACPEALRVLDTEDLHSLRHARQQLLKQARLQQAQPGPVMAGSDELFNLMAEDDMAQRELAAIYRCDLSLMISRYEMDLLQTFFNLPAALLVYCPFLSRPSVPAALPSFNERQHFVTIGNFRHEPNWDAVLWLKQGIWPLIRAQLPSAELHIYGAYPPPKATQLHKPREGFYVKGWADDAQKVMQQARLCLAPLRFGAGIKGKLMDALFTRTPSITTPIGAEGMMAEHNAWPGAIGDTAEAFAAAAVALYNSEPRWQQAQQCGDELLRSYWFAEDNQALLQARIRAALRDKTQLRRANIVGQLLRNQAHQSVRYKSLWIETKQRLAQLLARD